LPRIQNAATPFGYEVRQTPTLQSFWNLYDQKGTALILVDLEGERDVWTVLVEGLVTGISPTPRIVAFGPHADVKTLDLALELGCDSVLTKGQFSSSLAEIVESRGATAAGA
jgi:hypothetical protein